MTVRAPLHLTAALTALALFASACGAGSTSAPPASPTPTPTPMSGSPTPAPAPPDDDATDDAEALPAATLATRDRILSAARAGDLERLAELALEGDRFTGSFGDDLRTVDELTAYWRQVGDDDLAVLEVVIALLGLRSYTTTARDAAGEEVTIHVWPRAQSEDATEQDRQELAEVFGAERVERWHVDGMYLGWRIGITAEGDWQFLVAGD